MEVRGTGERQSSRPLPGIFHSGCAFISCFLSLLHYATATLLARFLDPQYYSIEYVYTS